MIKQIEFPIFTALALSSVCSLAFAISPEQLSSSSLNQDGYFIGIGGSYNSIKAELHPSGTLTAVTGFPPRGIFTATTGSFDHTEYGFAPEMQFGYFHHVRCSDWMWGVKFQYQYLQLNNTENNVYLHYKNALIDNQATASVETRVSHELAALAFIGHSFTNGHVYLGVGPSLSATQNRLSNLSDKHSGYYLGHLDGFSNQSQWLWSGLVQAGASLYLNPTWFLDFNYTYAITGWHKSNNSQSYSSIIHGGLNSGTVSFDTSKRMTEQALIVSINKVFSG